MKSAKTLSIIIISYKAEQPLRKLLKLLPKRDDWEVIVVDNNVVNRGFGGGCNEGARKAKGKLLLFLNPDVVIRETDIKTLITYLEKHPNVGIVGPQILKEDGEVEHTSTALPSFGSLMVASSFLNSIFPDNAISQEFFYKGWDRKKTREVGAVTGAVFVMRATDFHTIQGFDENFFLYWEEFDLAQKLQQIKKTVVYVAEAKAVHQGQASSQDSAKLKEIFLESRSRYIQKYFGFTQRVILQIWLNIFETFRIVSLVGLAFFLRTFQLNTWLSMIGDLGRDYVQALDLIQGKAIPLLGIPSSIPRFMQGPSNVYFDALSFLLGGANPFSAPLFAAVVTSAMVGLLYAFLRKKVGAWIAWSSSLLVATSPLAVVHSRMPFYLFAVPFAVLILLFVAEKFMHHVSNRSAFLLTLAALFMFQWELATVPLFSIVALQLFKVRKQWRSWIKGVLLAFPLGLLPQILYDLTHACSQICILPAWIGYRILGVTGVVGSEHATSIAKISSTTQQFFFQLSRMFGEGSVWIVPSLFLFIGLTIVIHRKSLFQNNIFVSALVGTISLMLAIFIHGSPSEAYIPPLLILLPILITFGLSQYTYLYKMLGIVFLLVLSIFQTQILLHHHFFAQQFQPQLEVTRWILQEAQGKPIELKSSDDAAIHETYLDHLKFLLKIQGGVIGSGGETFHVLLDPHNETSILDTRTHIFDEIRAAHLRTKKGE